MYGFGLCEIPAVLQIVYFIKTLINLVKFIVPIGLILMVMLDMGKGVISGDKKPGEIIKASGNKFLAAIIIFVIPTIVDFSFGLVSDLTNYESCWANANATKIKEQQVLWDEEVKRREEEEKKRKEEERREEEEEAKREEEEKKEFLEYDSVESHTNSINGIKYKLYNQSDERWKGFYFGDGQDISKNGCMITSVAVVVSAYDHTVTPLTVFKSEYRHSYPYNGINKLANGSFSCKHASITRDAIVDNLKKGNIAVIMVKDKSAFTSVQHYMALLDIKKDGSEIFVGNSYGTGKGTYNRTGWFKTDVVLTDVHEFNLCVPSSSLIEKFN